ncbi:MAG: hypothetical protein AAFR21_14355 [Pseudomonadota bacterium]
MEFRPKVWTSLGLGLAVLGSTSLTACGADTSENTAPVSETLSVTESGETGEGGEAGERGESGEGGHANPGALPRPLRLAFMTGHVEAGLALYRAGEPGMAAKHLLHPVSETHAAERAGLDELGFRAELFEAVSKALDEGLAASEIEPQLQAAEANLAGVAEKAGGDPVEIITFLMNTINEEYAVGVTDGAVTDPGEYQDAYGFAIVARDRAVAFEGEAGESVRAEIETLIGLWPGTPPVPTDDPMPLSTISAQTSLVLLELTGVQ